MKLDKSLENSIRAKVDADTASRRADLQQAIADATSRAEETQAKWERDQTTYTMLDERKAKLALTKAKDALASFESAVAERASSAWAEKLSRYVIATQGADRDAFLASVTGELDEIVRLEGLVRSQVDSIAKKAAKQNEAAREAHNLCGDLGIDVPAGFGSYGFVLVHTKEPQRDLKRRIIVANGFTVDGGHDGSNRRVSIADWLEF